MPLSLFPEGVSYGMKGGPIFKTDVVEADSAFDQRNQRWASPRWGWEAPHGPRTKTQQIELRNFFILRRGRFGSFLFKDWGDYTSEGQQLIGVGDDSTQVFQLVKTYTNAGESESFIKTIKYPKEGSIKIYLDGVELPPLNNWEHVENGLIQLEEPPPAGVEVTAEYEFYFLANFQEDSLVYNIVAHEVFDMDFVLVEVRE